MLEQLARDVIKGEAENYMYEANTIYLIRNEFVPIYCLEIINEAGWDIGEEDFFEDCLEHVIYEHIMDLIVDCVEIEKDRLNTIALEAAFDMFVQRSTIKEAINELVFLTEQQDEEKRIRNKERVEGHELSTFMMERPDIGGNSFGDGQTYYDKYGYRNGKNTQKMDEDASIIADRSGNLAGNTSVTGNKSLKGNSITNQNKKLKDNGANIPGASRSPRKKKELEEHEVSKEGPFYRKSGTRTFYNEQQ